MSSPSPPAPQPSRTPSPSTPEALDKFDPVAIHSDIDLFNSGYLSSLHQLALHPQWDHDFLLPRKPDDAQMLRLDELIDQHAYDESLHSSPQPSAIPHSFDFSSPSIQMTQTSPPPTHHSSSEPTIPPDGFPIVPRNPSIASTRPIPPPASLLRKSDVSSLTQRVVYPPKESCYNLPIMVPSIPEGGTKSRVETQVRVTVDLADASSSSDPYKYDCVGSWKWLKLPSGTATKRRTRKQGKIDPDPQDILHLSVTVTCASPPHNRVLSCSSCQAREAKRVAKKLAARVRPARSDTDSDPGNPAPNKISKNKYIEDTTSIIQFNCAEILDFSSGSAVLPLRITCYCRHHREKVGFNVHFTMMDCAGRIVGAGSSRSIMITDDHKTAPSANSLRQAEYASAFMNVDTEWSQVSSHLTETTSDSRAPSKRKKESVKRAKPYDSSNKPSRGSREGSVASVPSPDPAASSLPLTRSPSPSSVLQQLLTTDHIAGLQQPSLQHSPHTSDLSSSETLITPPDRSPEIPNIIDVHKQQEPVMPMPSPSPLALSAAIPSVVMPTHPHPMPFVFFDPNGSPLNLQLQVPIIHRLIPSMGPTHGGIEVTVLGANFHPSLQLNCIFGDTPASSTQRWSDNTLVCVLPPRAAAGVVAVWFDGFPKMIEQPNTPPSLFTYSDESDRALMELALQVVGLKMTGKIEDAKNVAMRIVGGSDNPDMHNGGNMIQLASSIASTRDLRPQLLIRAGESGNFESLIIDFLKVLDVPLDKRTPDSIATFDAISHATSSGQTLLHLAAFLGFSSLITHLLRHGIDIDMRDKNGYTALHFAVLAGSEQCVRALLAAGADREVVNAFGKTPEECSTNFKAVFDDPFFEGDTPFAPNSDEEAEWGDAETDGGSPIQRPLRKRSSRRRMPNSTPCSNRSANVSRSSTPTPDSDSSKIEKKSAVDVAVVPDAKQTASFIEMIQRTLAQLPAPQGIIPNMPQLPLPQIPYLPLPEWGALPQIPMVFPVYVPMIPGLPTFFGGEHQGANTSNKDKVEGGEVAEGTQTGKTSVAATEWRSMWERWFAVAVAMTVRQQQEMPPPMYTPREEVKALPPPVPLVETSQTEGEVAEASASVLAGSSSGGARLSASAEIRPVYKMAVPIPEQEVNAFEYQPTTKQSQKLQKKHDKMLLMFWLPIFFISALWAIHTGIQFTYHGLKTVFPKPALVKN